MTQLIIIVTVFAITMGLSQTRAEVLREPSHSKDSMFRNSDIERTLNDGTVQKFDGDEYKIVRRHQKKAVEKKPEPEVELRTRAAILVGYGSMGNLRQSGDRIETQNGPVLGLQLSDDVTEDSHLLIQVQTNETFSLGLGVNL